VLGVSYYLTTSSFRNTRNKNPETSDPIAAPAAIGVAGRKTVFRSGPMKKFFTPGTTIVGTLFVAVAAMLSGPVFAGIDCEDPKFSDHPKCTGGGAPPEQPDTEAGWGGNYLFENSLRGCHLGDMKPDGTVGHYKCDLGTSITFNLPVVPDDWTIRGGDPGLCGLFMNVSMTPDTNYAYAWGDKPCLPGSCEIHILNWFYENEIDGVGLINLDAYGWATNALFDSNPFAVPQVVDVYEINLTLKAEGKNRTIATCKWGESLVNGPVFVSDLKD
jgi:hypothetical protein